MTSAEKALRHKFSGWPVAEPPPPAPAEAAPAPEVEVKTRAKKLKVVEPSE